MRDLLIAVVLLVAACGATTKQIAATATIATVQTVDAGIAEFTRWALDEEDRIADEAISACKGKATPSAYRACTDAVTTPRRAPIDRARSAIKLYRAALAGGSSLAQRDLEVNAQAVIEAVGAVGIKVLAGGVL